MKYWFVLLLAGCATTKPEIKADDFIIASCIKKQIIAPNFVSGEALKAMTSPEYIKAMEIDRGMRIIYIGELEAVVAGCR